MNAGNSKDSGSGRLFTVSFTALLVGQIISIMGDRLNNIALIELISIETGRFRQTTSAFELSKLALAMTLPSLVLGPLVGAFVDRVRRKRVLITSDVVRGFAVLTVPFLRPALPMWTVYGVVALLYFTNLFFLPARCAIVPEIVSREKLMRANSMLSLGATLATIVGFGLGGIVVTHAGWRAALIIDAASYFISAGALALLVPRAEWSRNEPAPRVSYLSAVREALGEIRKSVGARAGVLIPPVLIMAGTIAYVLGVALIEARSERGTMTVGFLISLAGAGMALGCYFAGRVLHHVSREKIVMVGTLCSILPLAAVGLTQGFLVAGLAMALAGFAAGPVFVASETAIQEETLPRRQATVFAVRDMLMKSGSALAAVAAPAVATFMGLGAALAVLVCLLVPVLGVMAYRRS